MGLQVLQRAVWHGTPIRHGDTFVILKESKHAECQLWSHPFGWELRLIDTGELCRSQDEVFDTSDQWKAAMREKGWQ